MARNIQMMAVLLLVAGVVLGDQPAAEPSPAPQATPTPAVTPKPIPAARRIPAELAGVFKLTGDESMHIPTDVCVDADGRVIVADGVNDRLVVFDPSSRLRRFIRDIGGVRLKNPVGVAVDQANNLWVADNGNHRIVRIGPRRTDAEAIALAPDDGDKPPDPTDVAVADDGTLYVVDNDGHHIRVRRNGRFTVAGRFGESLGGLRWPFEAALDSGGALYVTEAIGGRVQRLSRTLQWTRQIGQWGVRLGQLYRPKGIAVDARDRVYVSDSTLGVVQVFKTTGEFVGVLTNESGGPLRFSHPMGLCFDASGRLLVVEAKADQVTRVRLNPDATPGGGS